MKILGLLRGLLWEYLPYSRQAAARKGERWRKDIGEATQYGINLLKCRRHLKSVTLCHCYFPRPVKVWKL